MAYQLLRGKKGIISGALDENSIAWHVALRCHEEGASLTLTNAPIALRMGKIHELAEKVQAEVIPADATKSDDWKNLFTRAKEIHGGGVDFVLHSIGMSPNVRKNKPYTDLDYDFYFKTLDISAASFHKMIQTAYHLDAINEWGSIVGLSYIAAQRVFPNYNDMADAKALLESIARCWGYHYGIKKKVRVNTVSQSPTPTTAGTGVAGFDVFYRYAEFMSPLGNATADDCANWCVLLFSDLSRKVTMQNLYHDGGYSCVGVSEKLMELFSRNA
ncbi:MAG: enoyl-ACP reductase [Chitinophagales bacterium]|nr:enoyl-ACP reductase [Chitinophagales bacterium]MDW8428708.1 enoyl-ACP reductase [Chitinophagales bacterium]